MNAWLCEVQAKTDQFITEGDSVALLGAYKDHSSFYLTHFPQWDFHPISTNDITGTDIRDTLFYSEKPLMPDWEGKLKTPEDALKTIKGLVPAFVLDRLRDWTTTETFGNLSKEYEFIKNYKKSWESAPYPPTFVCTDAVVVCSGHVLVIKRKINPGKGLYALPGGFLKPSETLEQSMLRELREETGIRVDKLILASSIVNKHMFDHPDRSLRGRTITEGFYLKLKDGKLPEVKGNDDAAEALWLPLVDVFRNENKFYDDHVHIINYFVGFQGGI
jgi:bifunctional NMN adenylyltransferase/nudix hydrolase